MNRQPATRASRRMTLPTSIVAMASEPSAIAFATPARASTTAKRATSLGGPAKTRPLGLAAPNLRRISGRPVPALEENAATAIGAPTESRCAAPRPDGLSSKRRAPNKARIAHGASRTLRSRGISNRGVLRPSRQVPVIGGFLACGEQARAVRSENAAGSPHSLIGKNVPQRAGYQDAQFSRRYPW